MKFVRCKVLKDFPLEWIRRAGDEIEIAANLAETFEELGYLAIITSCSSSDPKA
jgi:hypothetical protein